jgi:hypothetical protein
MSINIARKTRIAALAALVVGIVAGSSRAVEYANIDVADGAAPTNTTPPTVSIPAGQGTAGFNIDAGSVVGEIPIRIGASATDDAAGGILVAAPRETRRTAVDYGAGATGLFPSVATVFDNDVSSENTRNVSGGVALVTDRAGSQDNTAPYPVGSAMNANLAAAYFPFADGWKGGTAWSADGSGVIDTFLGSAGITFDPTIGAANTANVRPNYFFTAPYDAGDPQKNGDHFVSIPGVSDSRQQGILLAMGAKNEDNFAAVSATSSGDGWLVNTRGNSVDSPNVGESDNFSFVFVPLGTPNVTMAAMWGAEGLSGEPAPVLKSGNNFSLVKYPTGGNGNFRLTIDGHTPSSGVLIVGSESTPNGSGGLPGDNLVTYRPDGDGWIIVSDDLPTANDTAGQNAQRDEPVPYFHFVFLPFNAAPGTPTIQAPAWGKNSVYGYNVEVQEILASGNNNDDANGPDQLLTISTGSPGLNYQALATNRADNRIHVSGAIPSENDGMMFATISQGLRDNTATGGVVSYGIAAAYVSGAGQWVTATSVADQFANDRLPVPPNPAIAGEANYDYSMAFFGANSGFQMGTVDAVTGGTGLGSVTLGGVNSLTDGVLMANNADNEDNYVTVLPKVDGAGWDVQNWDNGASPQNFGFNWIYLPYDTDNLVAGRVNPDGTLINSTPTGDFTLTKTAAGTYELTVNGRTPDQGMLLLTAEDGSDHQLVYEPIAGNKFRILAVDPVNQAEFEFDGAAPELEDTGFQFAFVDFVTPPSLTPSFSSGNFTETGGVDGADFVNWKGGFGTATGATHMQGDANGDGDVDGGDFLVWQSQFGAASATGSAQGVPEPASLALALVLGVAFARVGRGTCGRR